ncbi:hypothetical protein EZV62_011489 [Acer yangbiense]|uniref:Uncharacterized protein n=1 Tax=Acer yangbiense TaxID=1000413 RepID=A0A5C7I5W5_9ROSI|nr:hypothetical protein EZV62_011489 [Acer yangbiense]
MDLKLNRCTLFHEMYNVIMDFQLSIDIHRVVLGGPLIKYEHEGCARIGIMPRRGDANSIKWFNVESNCTFHILNCFENGDEVVVWRCRALESIIPGPDLDYTGIKNKYGYAQVADSTASSASGMPKFGGLAKLHLDEPADMEELIKVEYHKFEENVFCTGFAFVSRGRRLQRRQWLDCHIRSQ